MQETPLIDNPDAIPEIQNQEFENRNEQEVVLKTETQKFDRKDLQIIHEEEFIDLLKSIKNETSKLSEIFIKPKALKLKLKSLRTTRYFNTTETFSQANQNIKSSKINNFENIKKIKLNSSNNLALLNNTSSNIKHISNLPKVLYTKSFNNRKSKIVQASLSNRDINTGKFSNDFILDKCRIGVNQDIMTPIKTEYKNQRIQKIITTKEFSKKNKTKRRRIKTKNFKLEDLEMEDLHKSYFPSYKLLYNLKKFNLPSIGPINPIPNWVKLPSRMIYKLRTKS